MYSQITVILLLFCLFASSIATAANNNQNAPNTTTTTLPPPLPSTSTSPQTQKPIIVTTAMENATFLPGCLADDQTKASDASLGALAVIASFQVLFSICVTVALVFILQKLGEKMREAETHLHQVMDATLCALLPQSVITEINAVAEEAQNQNKKPKEASKRDEIKDKENNKTNKSAKSPAQKE